MLLPPYSYSNHGPPSGYSAHGPSGPSGFSSYTGPDPYSAYSSLHPDISSISDLHEHATGFDHDHHHHHEHSPSFADDSQGYESQPPPSFQGHDQFSAADAMAGAPSAASPPPLGPTGSTPTAAAPAIEKSSPYRRISVQKRQINPDILSRYIN